MSTPLTGARGGKQVEQLDFEGRTLCTFCGIISFREILVQASSHSAQTNKHRGQTGAKHVTVLHKQENRKKIESPHSGLCKLEHVSQLKYEFANLAQGHVYDIDACGVIFSVRVRQSALHC